jgi:hypothetical protein
MQLAVIWQAEQTENAAGIFHGLTFADQVERACQRETSSWNF